MNTMNTVWLTSNGMQKLKAEHAQLKSYLTGLRRDIRNATLSFDNDISAEKKLEQEVAQSKLGRLEALLVRAKQLQASYTSASVGVGSEVHYEQGGETHAITLVNSVEADPSEGRISVESPLGKALTGKKAGDVAYMVTPVGERKFRIVTIQ